MAKRGGKREQLDADGLTPRQRRFCLEYLANDGNGAAAARAAGYSARCAAQQALENLEKAAVKAYLEPRLRRRVQALEKKLELKAERLDEELARIAYVDPGKLVDQAGRRLELHELDEDTRRAISGVKLRVAKVVHGKAAQQLGDRLGVSDQARGVEDGVRPVEEVTLGTVEVKLSGKVEAIGLAYKRLGLLKDRLEVTTKLSHEQLLVLAQRLREQRLAARAGAAGGKPAAPARGAVR